MPLALPAPAALASVRHRLSDGCQAEEAHDAHRDDAYT
jgi:hypothetical protein